MFAFGGFRVPGFELPELRRTGAEAESGTEETE